MLRNDFDSGGFIPTEIKTNNDIHIKTKIDSNKIIKNMDTGEEINLLDAEIEIIDSVDVDIETKNVVIEFDIEKPYKKYPEYKGDYEVTPKVSSQVLETKNLLMTDDVTIFQVPYSEVSNPSGGKTVTIGLE